MIGGSAVRFMLTIETTQQKKTENGAKKDTKLILKGTPITFTLQSARILTESYIRERGAAESQIAECDADRPTPHTFFACRSLSTIQ